MKFGIYDRYQTATDFEKRAALAQFPVEVWTVAAELFERKAPITALELEKITGLQSHQVCDALDRLVAQQLVQPLVVSWKDFSVLRVKARSSGSIGTVPDRVPQLAPPAPQPAITSVAVSASIGKLPVHDKVSLRLGSIAPQKSTAETHTAWIWQKPDSAQVAKSMEGIAMEEEPTETSEGFRLRPLLKRIESIKGGGVEGQLLVYQVFLHVPFQLLHDEGIRSLHLVDDQTVIKNPELYNAIVKAAKQVTGIELSAHN